MKVNKDFRKSAKLSEFLMFEFTLLHSVIDDGKKDFLIMHNIKMWNTVYMSCHIRFQAVKINSKMYSGD